MKRIIQRVFTFGIALAACFFITAVYLQKTQAASANTMTIYAIDLGQNNEGEATMVVSGNGASLLIDTGDSNTKNLFSWLKSNGYKDKKFDILLTHWHDDHVLYTARLIKDYNIGTVYIPGTEYLDNQYYRNIYSSILSIAKTRKTKVVYLKKRMQIDVGNNVVGKVLYVNGYYGNGSKLERFNNQSAAIMFTGGGSRFLACGDAMKAEENALLSSGESLRADIFKMNHHGYPSSNTRDFIKRVKPSYAWFTTHDAMPEHYNPESVKEIVRRTSATANMLSTRYNGTIRYLCSGGSISVSAERNVCKMYRRARNKKTGDEKTFTFTLNKQAVPKITDKMINSNVYTSWQVDQNGNTFSGKLVYDSSGNCYLRDTSGMYAVDTFAKADDKYYWLEENGRRFAKGWKVLDGKRYYLAPYRMTGFKEIKGNTYYFMNKSCSGYKSSDEGAMLKGFVTVSGRRYYLTNNKISEYQAYRAGIMVTGWNTISGKRYYMNNRGVIQKGRQKINGYTYYFDKYGIMLTGLKKIGSGKYYFDLNNGRMRYKWRTIGGERYYFQPSGKAITGWHQKDGKVYYAYESGKHAHGYVTIDGERYQFDSVENGCALLSNNSPIKVVKKNTNGGSKVQKIAVGAVEEDELPDDETEGQQSFDDGTEVDERSDEQDGSGAGSTGEDEQSEAVDADPGTDDEGLSGDEEDISAEGAGTAQDTGTGSYDEDSSGNDPGTGKTEGSQTAGTDDHDEPGTDSSAQDTEETPDDLIFSDTSASAAEEPFE